MSEVEKDWYYMECGQEKGPVGWHAVRVLIASGEIGPTTPLRMEGWSHWQTARCCEFGPLFDREPPPLRPMTVALLQPGGGQVRFHLAGIPLMIGRAGDCDISVPDPSLSAHHARFTLAGDTAYIEDLGSPEGTEVNLQPVVSTRPLASGDSLRLGGWRADLHVEAAEPLPPPRPAPGPDSRRDIKRAKRRFAARILAAGAVAAVAGTAATIVRMTIATREHAPRPAAPDAPTAAGAAGWPHRGEKSFRDGFKAGNAAGREWVSRSTFAELREIPGTEQISRSMPPFDTKTGAVYGPEWTNGFVAGFRNAHGRAPKRFEEFTGRRVEGEPAGTSVGPDGPVETGEKRPPDAKAGTASSDW